MRHRSARLGDHLGGTRKLAAVDGDGRGSGQSLLHFFVSKNNARQRAPVGCFAGAGLP